MQFFQTTVILIDFEMKQANNGNELCCWPSRMSNGHLAEDNNPNYIVLYILTKLCLHSHHINKHLINGLLTNLQDLLKNHYFSTCFHACNTVSCRHNLLTNCEMLVCGLQSFSIVLNKIRITFTASNWYLNFIKLYIYNI